MIIKRARSGFVGQNLAEKTNQDIANSTRSLATSTKWLAAATILTVCVLILQFFTLIKSDQTLRDTLDANEAAERAAISILKIEPASVKDASGKVLSWNFTPYIQNSGKTIAVNIRSDTDTSFWSPAFVSLYPGVDLPDAPGDPEFAFRVFPLKGMGIMGPNAEPTASVSANIPVEAIKQSTKGKRSLVSGIVGFRDVSKGTIEHKLKFCFIITTKDMWDGNSPPGYSSCEFWNCVDDYCDEDKKDYERTVEEAFRKAGMSVPKNFIRR
jgi:hypothetical protein